MCIRDSDMTYPRNFADKPGELLLEVKGLSAATGISDINIEVRRGEIVGLCGLVGSGRSEVARAIFGGRSRDIRRDCLRWQNHLRRA